MEIGRSIVHYAAILSLYNSVWEELDCSISHGLLALSHNTVGESVNVSTNIRIWR